MTRNLILIIAVTLLAKFNYAFMLSKFDHRSICSFALQAVKKLSDSQKIASANEKFNEEFEDFRDHLPQFLKKGLAPRTNPDYPQKLRKQYKTMFGGQEMHHDRKTFATSNKELKAGK